MFTFKIDDKFTNYPHVWFNLIMILWFAFEQNIHLAHNAPNDQ